MRSLGCWTPLHGRVQGKAAGFELEREVLTKQARELGLQLAQARDQGEQYRQLLSVTRQPSAVMVEQCKRLTVRLAASGTDRREI